MKTFVKIFVIAAALVLIGSSVVALALSAYHYTEQKTKPLVFSKNEMLLDMWNSYKKKNIEISSGRTVDRDQDNISTSEGQSYALLRAVWMDDRETFDMSFTWTQKNLQRSDNLFAWRYGPLDDGSGGYGIQTSMGGQNTATDGDSDIALALLMAYSRWSEPDYLEQAKPIIKSIWAKQVVVVNGKPVLAANDLERNSQESIIVNPSYFAPYAYRIFAHVDKENDWNGLVDNSYRILSDITTKKIGSTKSSGLPPDWLRMNRTTGEYVALPPNLTANYGYDAMRITWRIGLDWVWYQDERSKQILKQFDHLADEWKKNGKLAATYGHDGSVVQNYESPAMYGTAIGYFKVIDPITAENIYKEKLQRLYNPDTQAAIDSLSYYDANWAWFGIGLAQDALPNIADK